MAEAEDCERERLSGLGLLAADVACSRSACNLRTVSNKLAAFGKSSPRMCEQNNAQCERNTIFQANDIKHPYMRT